MIDFYKHSFLSVFGKNAGAMSEIEYQREIINNYNKYLEALKQIKETIGESTTSTDTELYL